MSRRLSRKELFSNLFSAVREVAEKSSLAPRSSPERWVRPPGALARDPAYLAACSGCEACVKACPYAAIFMVEVGSEAPRRVAVLDPARTPCRLCSELPCIPACKDGALVHPGSPRRVHLGIPQVDPRVCRTFRGELCDLCVRYCPLREEAIRLIGTRPVVLHNACTGCGICATVCPDRAIVIIPERDLIPGMRIPRDVRRSSGFAG